MPFNYSPKVRAALKHRAYGRVPDGTHPHTIFSMYRRGLIDQDDKITKLGELAAQMIDIDDERKICATPP